MIFQNKIKHGTDDPDSSEWKENKVSKIISISNLFLKYKNIKWFT